MSLDITRGRILGHQLLSKLRRGPIVIAAFLAGIGGYAIHETNAHANGQNIANLTQKYTNQGCYCHCSSANSSTTVTLATGSGSSPFTAAPSTAYTFTITVANSNENDGGCEIASYSGNGLAAGTDGLQLINGELTHSSPKAFTNNSCSWTFTYTTGSVAGWDTLYANGNAVNGDNMNDGGNCTDKWNWAPKYIIHTVVPPKRIALGRSSISFGSVRVGHRIADSLLVSSDGDAAITISSSAMKSGTQFSSYPTTTNRSLNPGTTEMDSAIFAPTARGTYNDSLIFTTNSDTVPQQHLGVYVSGQGIQGIFNSTNGNSLSFGNLRVGSTTERTFAFSNTGDDTLFLNTPSISGAGFTIVSGPASLTLPPNQSGSVVVQFAPTAKQSYAGTLSFTALNGVSAPSVTLSGTGTLPQIQISSPQDLGPVRVGLTLQGTVTLENTGTDTLHISNASLTQPSTRFTLGAYDQTVVPGATGVIHIAYLPDSERTDTATLHFTTDDPSESAVSVRITGTGALPHMVLTENRDTLDLGQVKVNASATQDIAITNTGGADLNLTNITAGPAPFSLAQSPTIVSGGTTAYATVRFAPTAMGSFTGMLLITGDDAANPTDTVYLTGTGINSALSITPANLDFGAVPVSSTVIDTIALNNTGSASVKIIGYRLTPATGAFVVIDSSAKQVAAGASARVILSFHPDTAGSYAGTLTLTTDDANTPMRTINLSGRGVKGLLSVVPSSINFGSVALGHDSIISVSLQNTGQASVTISAVAFAGTGAAAFNDGGFSTPITIAAGGSTSLNIGFTPTTAESYQGTAQLTLGDGSSLAIALQGLGISSSGVESDQNGLREFSLSISPNPARNAVTVHTMLAQPSEIRLAIFNAVGQEVLVKSLGVLSEGSHDVVLSTTALASGSYFIRISNANGNQAETKMIIE
ncbi:MAG TPA: choice-of-anchor D domain-containing protein [Candidatus Kapabacteria bacterium]|nr:choice-of-anchor D domain-containing protein [Candidatus Kapabacteria bacterium]HET6402529.1 choice-of-anchor D domain-containing protein [Candidatus Kapabacteria bacterium]